MSAVLFGAFESEGSAWPDASRQEIINFFNDPADPARRLVQGPANHLFATASVSDSSRKEPDRRGKDVKAGRRKSDAVPPIVTVPVAQPTPAR